MDKPMQESDGMRDEEIYALLDKAMEDEKLCVSDELIQKTLRRVKEENEAEVISMEKPVGKKYRMMQYTGVVAAAMLLVFFGSRILNGTGAIAREAKRNAMQESTARHYNGGEAQEETGSTATDGIMEIFSETATSMTPQSVNEALEDSMGAENFAEPESRAGSPYEAVPVAVSAELREAAGSVVGVQITDNAEYWEFVQRETDWQKDVMQQLENGTLPEGALWLEGNYRYVLAHGDGSQTEILSDEPLDAITRIETEQGALWCLLGESVRFCME